MRVTVSDGSSSKREGFLESEDDLDEVKFTASVMDRTFQRRLWDQINIACQTVIDEYEGVWLDPPNLMKAAIVIRQSLSVDNEAPHEYVASLGEAVEMLESCAKRDVRVMFSL